MKMKKILLSIFLFISICTIIYLFFGQSINKLQGKWRNEFLPELIGININGIDFFSKDSLSIIYRKNIFHNCFYEIKNKQIWIYTGEKKINLGKYKINKNILHLDIGVKLIKDTFSLKESFRLAQIPTSTTINLHNIIEKGNEVLPLWKDNKNVLYIKPYDFKFPVFKDPIAISNLTKLSNKKTIGKYYVLVGKTITLEDLAKFYTALLYAGYNYNKELILILGTNDQGYYNILIDEVNQLWTEDFSKIIPNKTEPPPWGVQFHPKRSDFIKRVDSIVTVSTTEDVNKLRQLRPLKRYLISFSKDLSMSDYVKAKENCQYLEQRGHIVKTEIRLE